MLVRNIIPIIAFIEEEQKIIRRVVKASGYVHGAGAALRSGGYTI